MFVYYCLSISANVFPKHNIFHRYTLYTGPTNHMCYYTQLIAVKYFGGKFKHKLYNVIDPTYVPLTKKIWKRCQSLGHKKNTRLRITEFILKKNAAASQYTCTKTVFQCSLRLMSCALFLLSFCAFVWLEEMAVKSLKTKHCALQRSVITTFYCRCILIK